ncbi:O-antigen ligase-like membrane protein [Aquimarina brevivitae]|uniref:O-antigen ligase-like membrane protein n=2 Tax=Aquimarina brevivitae TaxID=323412 RepID=A0A4Q7PK19_9FLAO|nr:O-antigen ligase-like membrane protein [Aquimarina brevivitae]
MLLGLAPLVFLGKLNKYVVYLLIFFTLTALISLWTTSKLDFIYLQPSLLKRPYWITLGRFLEIVSCLVLCNLAILFFRHLKQKQKFDFFFEKFIDLNIIITVVFAIIYLAVALNLIPMDNTRLVYGWDTRLRGYFVEGGPYGLMLSFVFIAITLVKKTQKRIVYQIMLFMVIAFMAKSKAGILCCLVWIVIENFSYLKAKLKPLLLPILVLIGAGLIYLFINISSMYVKELDRVQLAVKERPKDPNLVMGRISGLFIFPKMVQEKPVFGIGTGNYPLLRNNKEYRGFFPLPPKPIRNLDAHGFGGIVDILVDNGLVGLLGFFSIMGVVFIKVRGNKGSPELLIGFIVLFLFGVQIHFMYPWVLLALVLANTHRDEASSRSEINS